jgi:hypothetical protein
LNEEAEKLFNVINLQKSVTMVLRHMLKATIVVSQQPAVTSERPVNSRGIAFSAQSMPMSVHATMECVINDYTLTEELFPARPVPGLYN